jgi:hypothetical protein
MEQIKMKLSQVWEWLYQDFWLGLKLVYWLAITIVAVVLITWFFFFRKPNSKAVKIKR